VAVDAPMSFQTASDIGGVTRVVETVVFNAKLMQTQTRKLMPEVYLEGQQKEKASSLSQKRSLSAGVNIRRERLDEARTDNKSQLLLS
jgi:hypothetical protein